MVIAKADTTRIPSCSETPRFKKHLRIHNAETFSASFLLITRAFVRLYRCISPSFTLLSGDLCMAHLCCLQVTHPAFHHSSWSHSRVVFRSWGKKDLGCRSSRFPALPGTCGLTQGFCSCSLLLRRHRNAPGSPTGYRSIRGLYQCCYTSATSPVGVWPLACHMSHVLTVWAGQKS